MLECIGGERRKKRAAIPRSLRILRWRDFDFDRGCIWSDGQKLELTGGQRNEILRRYHSSYARLGRAPKLGDYIFTNDNK